MMQTDGHCKKSQKTVDTKQGKTEAQFQFPAPKSRSAFDIKICSHNSLWTKIQSGSCLSEKTASQRPMKVEIFAR